MLANLAQSTLRKSCVPSGRASGVDRMRASRSNSGVPKITAGLALLVLGAAAHSQQRLEVKIDPRIELMADRKSTRLNSSHLGISYAVFCLKKKTKTQDFYRPI